MERPYDKDIELLMGDLNVHSYIAHHYAQEQIEFGKTAERLQEKHSINDVVAFCRKFNYTPIIVSRSNKDPEHICYLALEDMLQKTIEYRLNDENIEYEEFLDICNEYVKGRRRDDNTIRTSEGGKSVSSE